MSRVAAIDCGTNSIRLLIADLDGGRLTDVVRELRVVRLGAGVDRTGRLAPEALERTRAALHDYAATIGEHEVARLRMVATSATRDASNRADFLAMVSSELGIEPEVVTGEEEARLSFAGASSVLPADSGPLLVADVGGGSTELVRGGDGALRAYSMDIGCVRLTERHLHDDPPTSAQVVRTIADIRAAVAVARTRVPLDAAVPFVGVAGTVTTLAAMALGLPRYDRSAVHGARIAAATVAQITGRLLEMPRDERAAIPVMHPGRVDVIVAGALVLRTLLETSGCPAVIASEHDILDGIALTLGS